MALGESFHLSVPSFPGQKIWILIVPANWLVVRIK